MTQYNINNPVQAKRSANTREEILKKITEAKKIRKEFATVDINCEEKIYKPIEGSLEECFAKELEAVNGYCKICKSENEAFEEIKKFILENNINRFFCRTKEIAGKLKEHNITFSDNPGDFTGMEAGITTCEALVARTGSVMVSSATEAGRQMNCYPPIHLVLAKKSQLVPYVSNALTIVQEKYKDNFPSAITNITGPSRTADIEKTLVLGAHGPKEIRVFIY
jgi:L-lactate dehydrogenase complex protein LldG